MPITVSIIEDDLHYNDALKKIISFDPSLICLSQYHNGQEALESLPKLMPNVIITDINLPDFSGIEVVKKLKPLLPKSEFVMCTSFDDDEYVLEAIMAGAVGFLRKGESMDAIIEAIKNCANGGTPMSPGIAKRALQLLRNNQQPSYETMEQLTKSEFEILELMSQGMLYKEIANKKFISLDTVKKHVSNIYKKLHVNNKVEAINKLNKK